MHLEASTNSQAGAEATGATNDLKKFVIVELLLSFKYWLHLFSLEEVTSKDKETF